MSEEVITTAEMESMAYSLMSEQQRQMFLSDYSLDLAFFTENGRRFRANIFM